MKVCIFGSGYVGLVSAAGFAEMGNDVVCLDIDASRVEALQQGAVPIFEPGLDDLIARNVATGRLSFSTDPHDALRDCRVAFVAVGTPMRADGGADLSSVLKVAESVRANAKQEICLVLKSTVPVGTNERVNRFVAGSKFPIHVVSNPEFLREGEAVNDFLKPNRLVVGCRADQQLARSTMARLYKPLCLDRDRILWMDPASAELTKYVCNAMLALRISMMNEVAGLCEKVGADVHQVRQGVGSDIRIGPSFLYAGPGYGGSCFPKDVQALIDTARQFDLELELAGAAHRVNERQKGLLLRKLKKHLNGELHGCKIAVWGLAFKPRTNDIRESPGLTLIDGLLAEGARVAAHDPAALIEARQRFNGSVELVSDAYSAVQDAEALVLVTEWRQYQSPDFERVKRLMKGRLLIDGRNIWSSYGLPAQGFLYEGIGVNVS